MQRLIQIPNFPAKHSFSTRHAGDLRKKENWENPNNLATCVQTHSNHVRVIEKPGQYDDTDGLVTKTPGIRLVIFTADCAPLLLADSKNKVIANLHCGWKPFVKDIIQIGIEKMRELGAENIQAAIGPCINECCFECGKEVAEAFDNLLGEKCYTQKGEKYMVNLRKGVETRLNQLGITVVSHVNECTCCNVDKYFSYRAENGNTGRLGHTIEL